MLFVQIKQKMLQLENLLPKNIYDVIERASISIKEVLILSVGDIKKRTNLFTDDIILLKNIVADNLQPVSVTCSSLILDNCINTKVSTGCLEIDKLLNGGFRRGTLTEIYGESGIGKTQIGVQTTIHNWSSGCIYICTEDVFPVKRYEDIKRNMPCFNKNIDYGKHTFVEHILDPQDLIACIRVRAPKLLSKNKQLSLIILDSVAAPFRCESVDYLQRAEDLRELAIQLLNVAKEFKLAVLCINQVTASFDTLNTNLPSLGLAWSNMVSVRLCLKRPQDGICSNSNADCFQHTVNVRELTVVFAPDLPSSSCKFIISSSGLQSFK